MSVLYQYQHNIFALQFYGWYLWQHTFVVYRLFIGWIWNYPGMSVKHYIDCIANWGLIGSILYCNVTPLLY